MRILSAGKWGRRFGVLVAASALVAGVTAIVPDASSAHASVGSTCVPGDNNEPRASGFITPDQWVEGIQANITLGPNTGQCAGDTNPWVSYSWVMIVGDTPTRDVPGAFAQVGPAWIVGSNHTRIPCVFGYAQAKGNPDGTIPPPQSKIDCTITPPVGSAGSPWLYGITWNSQCTCEQLWAAGQPFGLRLILNTTWNLRDGTYGHLWSQVFDESDDVNTGLDGTAASYSKFENLQSQNLLSNGLVPFDITGHIVSNQHPGAVVGDFLSANPSFFLAYQDSNTYTYTPPATAQATPSGDGGMVNPNPFAH